MKDSTLQKLEGLSERLEELNGLLGSAEIIADQNQFRSLSREHSELTPIVQCFLNYQETLSSAEEARQMMADKDPDIKSLAEEELRQATERGEGLEAELQTLLSPKDPADDSNILLEVRAGTGGDEAALFAGDLLRMYLRY
ncbi:MAG: peptide chain release factor 1, partial [Gammaproteobacteria bacterium]